ncbi:DUF2922 domain-containing protein [Paraclostridium bifermentans]|uniref:DUF2922 domain-containing protein n=1 Tax=Paraclostridium bifermentans TaxID=1490 RepID=UPI00359CB272
METTTKLVMRFKTSIDRTVSISIDDPREDVTEAEIKTFMDLVLSKNIFAPNGGDIVSAIDAKIVVTDTKDYDLVI